MVCLKAGTESSLVSIGADGSINKKTPKPFLRWAGSKRQLVATLRNFWSTNFVRYIEPFAGSACLYFEIQPCNAILGDMNADLIHTYRMVKREPELVLEALDRLKPSKDEYYRVRAIDPKSLADAEKAAIFIFLNRHCFNGLYRTNIKGQFNVPFGKKTASAINNEAILTASAALTNTQLMCSDFEDVLNIAQQGDFVYLDPPYWSKDNKTFTEYGPQVFTQRDLSRLTSKLDLTPSFPATP